MLVSIDGDTNDDLWGENGDDSFWVDREGFWIFASNDNIHDATTFEQQSILHKAPETTPRIQEDLQLADGQWVFFDTALKRVGTADAGAAKPLTDVFVASENLLTVMDRVTGLYASLKT